MSGYIDFAHRLKTDPNMEAYFDTSKRLMPRHTDLSFYNWETHLSTSNPTPNFQVRAFPQQVICSGSGMRHQIHHVAVVLGMACQGCEPLCMLIASRSTTAVAGCCPCLTAATCSALRLLVTHQIIADDALGLLFKNKRDRKVLCVDPSKPVGDNSTKTEVYDENYLQVVLFDHVTRRRS